jgi:hypothetical protein
MMSCSFERDAKTKSTRNGEFLIFRNNACAKFRLNEKRLAPYACPDDNRKS